MSLFFWWLEINPANSNPYSHWFKKKALYAIFDHPSPVKKDLAYMLRKNLNTRCASLVLACLFLACSADTGRSGQPGNPAGVQKGATGIAVTPQHYPEHTIADVAEAFRLARTLGSHSVFIYQWQHLDLKITELMLTWSRKAGMTPIIGLSPTTLDQGRKELDLPADIRRKAGPLISFANPVIRQGFKQAAVELARLKPPYLCLATEINFLAMQRLPEYLHFASLYKEAYQEVKRVSPDTRVFVSFQWEWMRILDAREPFKIKEHSKVVDIFRPELDVIGLTTYPSPFHKTPGDLVADYYAWVYRHIRQSDEIVLMEVGWPTRGTGSELEQVAYIRRLPALLEQVNVSVVAWALLHDIELPAFDADLNSVGLITTGGQKKPGYREFEALKNRMR